MRSAVVFVVTAAVIALSGCSLVNGAAPEPGTSPEPPPPASTSAGPSDPVTPGPSDPVSPIPTAGSSQTPDDLGPVVGTRTTSPAKGDKVRLQLYPVTRVGNLSHLNLTVSSADGYQVAGLLSDGNYDAGDSTGHAADGITLVDGKHNKLYLVASDGQGTCLCSRDLSSIFLNGDEPFLISATFATPPADVAAVDVRIPGFGVFSRVPVR